MVDEENLHIFETFWDHRMRLFKMNGGWDYRGVTKLVSLLWKNAIFKTCTIEANHLYNRHWSWKTGSMLGISEKALGMGSWLVVWNIFVISRSILDGYKLILTSLLVSIGISTNQQRIYFCAGYLRLAIILPYIFSEGWLNHQAVWEWIRWGVGPRRSGWGPYFQVI